MFGFRADGRRIAHLDPMMRFAPYIMPQRVDAQVQMLLHIDCDVLTNYIREQRARGVVLSYMDLVVAAYVRTMSQHPALNRFVVNKQIFARNAIQLSLVVLKNTGDEHVNETTIKLTFDPYDTVFDVHEKMQAAIDKNRLPDTANFTDKFAHFSLVVPGLVTVVVGLARLLERYGLLPGFLLEISPFHTGMFLTNMASLGLGYVHHHIYNFGTTSIFTSMGKVEREAQHGADGKITYRRSIPMGVMIDERIAYGESFGRGFACWRDLLADPKQLETPPETIQYDIPPEKMRLFRRKRKSLEA